MMNKAEKIVVTGFAGTTVMTASSYLTSLLANKNFREPDHLSTMIGRLAPALSKQSKIIAGWGAHYAMGIVFASVYVELWEARKIKRSLKNALILGVISGIIGLLIWKGTFKLHPLPPWVDFEKYYLQRIPAHIVFAVAATLTYRLIENDENSNL